MTDATLMPPAATGLTVFDLREVPVAGEAGAGFLGQRLAVSHHPGWEFAAGRCPPSPTRM